jgi:hypothetical protein
MTRQLLRRSARGQGMVEMAIGLIVFVTILIFAIHFAEVGYLSVKVTESAHSAMFDATGYELHRWAAGDISQANRAASRAASDATSRYRDFDSRTRSSMTTSQVFTRAQNLRVQCDVGQGPDYMRDVATVGSYSDNGGISCQSTARISAFNIVNNFMDQGGGFFKTQHYVNRPINVSSMGRGNSNARLTMMLDDWGLTGTNENKHCPLNVNNPFGSCDNEAFFRLARNAYGITMGIHANAHTGAASRFAWRVVGVAPIPPMGESAFFMSAMGEEDSNFVQPQTSEGFRRYTTTPGGPATTYQTSHQRRQRCFLGLKCPPRS